MCLYFSNRPFAPFRVLTDHAQGRFRFQASKLPRLSLQVICRSLSPSICVASSTSNDVSREFLDWDLLMTSLNIAEVRYRVCHTIREPQLLAINIYWCAFACPFSLTLYSVYRGQTAKQQSLSRFSNDKSVTNPKPVASRLAEFTIGLWGECADIQRDWKQQSKTWGQPSFPSVTVWSLSLSRWSEGHVLSLPSPLLQLRTYVFILC
jgi:hypothetical protein